MRDWRLWIISSTMEVKKWSILKVGWLDIEKQSALHRAAFHGCEHSIRKILERTNLKVTSRDVYGDTPLHLAARNFHIHCLRIMLLGNLPLEKANKFLHAPNKKGESPFSLVQGTITRYITHNSKNPNYKYAPNDSDVVKFIENGDVFENWIVKKSSGDKNLMQASYNQKEKKPHSNTFPLKNT